MNKMLVAVFDSETTAFEGLNDLKALHKGGDISLYATAVLAKDDAGEISIKQQAEEGPVGTAIGMMTGSFIGILAGPVGVALGASLGGLTGMLFDLDKSGVDLEFVNDVSEALSPGKVAVLADLDESWTAPVDTRIGERGGLVFRRLRSEVIEDQYAREAAAFEAELAELDAELAEAEEEARAKIQAQIDALKEKSNVIKEKASERLEHAKSEAEARIATLQQQHQEASDHRKVKIEKRIAEVKADLDSRSAKLKEAGALAKEALAT